MTSNEDQPTKRRKRLDRSQAEYQEESVEERSIASRDLLEVEHKEDTHIRMRRGCRVISESLHLSSSRLLLSGREHKKIENVSGWQEQL